MEELIKLGLLKIKRGKIYGLMVLNKYHNKSHKQRYINDDIYNSYQKLKGRKS